MFETKVAKEKDWELKVIEIPQEKTIRRIGFVTSAAGATIKGIRIVAEDGEEIAEVIWSST